MRSQDFPDCPSAEKLAAYNRGALPEDKLRDVVDHLSACPLCRSSLEGLPEDDTLVSQLRRYGTRQPFVPEPECRQMETRARAIAVGASDLVTGPYEPDAVTLPNVTGESPAPRALGPYQLLEKLGQGGMGVVYKARQSSLNRIVALKMMRAALCARPEDFERFRIEGEAVARLRHPNVVPIYELSEEDGQPYFSMEFLEGGSLATKLAGRPQPATEAAAMVRTVARAVHAAHVQRIIHRDLKPSNILLTADGAPKVTDFGLAKLLDADSAQTQSETVLGTPSYMAPEQASGNSKEVGPLADVYALGAILYEMLTGRPPFRAATRSATLEQVQFQAPAPPTHWKPSLPRDLEAICLKCLEKEPAHRYASAEALAEDLERWLRGEPTLARPTRWPVRAWRAARRRAGLSIACLLGAVALILAATVLPNLGQDRPAEEDPDRPLRALEADLAGGHSVVLVGEGGPPRWFRWQTGAGGGQTSAAPDGTFTLHSWTLGLLELLPDPQGRRYRFRAEVRHEKSDNYGEVGIYCLHGQHPSAPGAVDCFCQLTFNDIRDARQDIAPAVLARTGPLLPGNMAQLQPRLYREPGLTVDHRLAGVSSAPFVPAGFRGGDWHRLEVTVGPETIEARWDRESFDSRKLARRDILKEFQELLTRPKLGLEPVSLGKADAAFPVRGALGLYVLQGSASFRRVVVEPLNDEP